MTVSVPSRSDPTTSWRLVWLVVGGGIAAMIATSPGQTAGVSAFIDPMVDGLGVSRSAVSLAYLVGTLCGAAALPLVGRAVDRFGALRSTLAVGVVYLVAIVGMSQVTGIVSLTVGFVLLRSMGQGSLGLIAVTVVSQRVPPARRGRALGVTSAGGGAGMALAPLFFESVIRQVGWRSAWLVGAAVVVGLLVLVLAVTVGTRPRAAASTTDVEETADPFGERSLDTSAAMREPWFWVLALSVGLSGMLITAIVFHQFDLLGERGLDPAQVAVSFIPNAVAALLATLVAGQLVDLVAPRLLVAAGMVLHTVSFLLALVAAPGLMVIVYAVVIGSAGGFLRTVEAATLVRLFGPRHLGALRGIVSAVAVGGTALGPVAYSLTHSATGGYTVAVVASALLPLGVAVWALLARMPAEDDAAV